MPYFVSKELYEKNKDGVIRLSLNLQRAQGEKNWPQCLTDAQIAQKLGLGERDVREIRCIAEIDLLESDSWEKAQSFKTDSARNYLERKKITR